MNTEDSYSLELSKNGSLTSDKPSIEASIEQHGIWEECIEWRISTIAESKIELVELEGINKYRVTVACDHIFSCVCPTLDRAIEMACLYQQLIFKLFHQVGWPSWAALDVLVDE